MVEVDQYRRFDVSEDLFNTEDTLFGAVLDVPLTDDTILLQSQYVDAVLEVRVETLY